MPSLAGTFLGSVTADFGTSAPLRISSLGPPTPRLPLHRWAPAPISTATATTGLIPLSLSFQGHKRR
jgi:hypothetical protein